MKAIVLAIWGMVAGLAAAAQESATSRNLDLTVRAEAGAVAQLLAAQDLFALARGQSDPLAALAAGRLQAGLTISAVDRQPTARAAEAGDLKLAGAETMFDLARALTLDEGLSAVIEAERFGAGTGAVRTVQASAGQVPGGGQDRWDLAFFAGALAEVAVIGPGTAVLDIVVQDAGGTVICLQAGPRDRLYCPFVPAENGGFSILVTAPGPDAVPYVLITN